MRLQAAGSHDPALELGQLLFTPGPRIGWTYRPHRDLIGTYPEPPPDPAVIGQQAAWNLAAEQRRWQRALKWAALPSLMVLVGLLALGGFAHAVSPNSSFGLTIFTGVIFAAPGLGWAAWRYTQLSMAKTADPQRQYQIAHAGWAERAAAHKQAELAHVVGIPEWGSAVASSPRLDIFGGTPESWRSLCVVHGASLMAERPLLLADLTGHYPADSLAALAQDLGVDVREYILPRHLNRSGILSQMSPRQLADALAEAVHAGTPGGARADRAVDVRILGQLASALTGAGITLARLAAGVQAALGRTIPPSVLSAEEATLIGGKLFGEDYKPQIGSNLIRLDAFLADLAQDAPAETADTRPGYCTIFATEPAARSARAEVTAALVIQWLTVAITAAAGNTPAVVIAGADEISRHHLERLADACDRRHVPLTLIFRHLRDDATTWIGSGSAAFMRLGNHHEAEQAATWIGRGHKFVLSGYTSTQGGDRTRTTGSSQTWGHSESRGFNNSHGWSRDGMLGGGSANDSQGRSRDYSRNYSYSTEQSESEGTNWSQATSTERVYEYTVEPTVLQNLPDSALLLINRGTSTSPQPVECDPVIVTFPGLSTSPHAPVPPHPSAYPQPAVQPHDQPALNPSWPQPRWPAAEQPRHAQPPPREPRKPWWQSPPSSGTHE